MTDRTSEAKELDSAIRQYGMCNSVVNQDKLRTIIISILDAARAEAASAALALVAEKLNHVAHGYEDSGHTHRATMLRALATETLAIYTTHAAKRIRDEARLDEITLLEKHLEHEGFADVGSNCCEDYLKERKASLESKLAAKPGTEER